MTDGVDRRDFLRNTLVAGGAAAAAAASVTAYAQTQQPGRVPGTTNHYHVPATDKTVHWGYFSKLLKPVVEVAMAAKPDSEGPQTALNASGYVTPRRRATIAARSTPVRSACSRAGSPFQTGDCPVSGFGSAWLKVICS